jgi:glycosyltransferase involved in cell wall biosynthesis|tara:strand:- start:717 stop:1553 length:837 start_codon:yes stop_codon:yes gene_type:complete
LDISVIIPTYNRRNTLSRAVESVLNQIYKPIEIIVVDDGSTDGTKEMFSEMYPLVRYIYQANSGVSSARNTGINSASGDWIALLDSDDEWLPDKLDRQVKLLQDNAEIRFCHTNEIWIRNNVRINQKKKHQKYGGNIFNKCLDICRISPSSSLFHTSVIKDVGLFDESLDVCEDYDLWLRITAKYPILFLDQPLIKKFGGHSDQLSRVFGGIEQYRIRSLEKILTSKSLSGSQFEAAKDMLIHKLQIYAKGLKKRDKNTELHSVEKKIHDWLNMSKLN